MNNTNLYLYILLRNDLPSMAAGRACAQASHASNAFMYHHGANEAAVEWSHQTPQGFGTAIVLSATIYDIAVTLDELKEAGHQMFNTVIDPDYVVPISAELVPFFNTDDKRIKVEISQTDLKKAFIHRSETTCAYVFGDKEELSPFLSKYSLYS